MSASVRRVITVMRNLTVSANVRPRCVFATVFWGDWHRDILLDANLPTLLAPGNLPAFAAGVDCEYLVYTTARDARRLRRNGAFRRLRAIMPVSVELFTPSQTKDVYALHHEIWRTATNYARQRAAFILFMPPDVAWADGSFARLRAVLEAGKRVMLMTYPRVVSETAIPAMLNSFARNANEALVIPPQEMMALAIGNLHPLMAAYSRFSPHFPVHPEMILWPIEGDGFLLRLLARELFCFEPSHVTLNEQSLLARVPPEDEIYVFQDSREFLGLSFTPLTKDADWYRSALDTFFVGRWWNFYDSPLNDHLSALDLRFTKGGGDEKDWRRASAAATRLMSHLRSAREFIRVALKLQKMGHSRAAAILLFALSEHGLARRWPHRGPFLIFVPPDEAFNSGELNGAPGEEISAARARELIERHTAVLPELALVKGGLELTTLAGTRLRLEDVARAERCGDHLILPLRDPQPSDRPDGARLGGAQLEETESAALDRRHGESNLPDYANRSRGLA